MKQCCTCPDPEKGSISGDQELMKLKEEARGLGDLRVPSFEHSTSEGWGGGSCQEP